MHKAVGIYYHVKREGVVPIARRVAELFRARQVEVFAQSPTMAENIGIRYLPRNEFLQKVTLMVVIGGDGTFLRAANVVREAGIPLVGINQGNLGFLTELEVDEFEDQLDLLIQENYAIEERMTIGAELHRGEQEICHTIGLNDITVNRNPVENTLELDVYYLGNQLIDSYQADGIIVATPTGSTGYSLSAGGPLIYPGTDCLIVTPICAHILGTNAIIVPADGLIDVHLTHSAEDAYLLTDGRNAVHLRQGDMVRVYKAQTPTRIVQLEAHQYFDTVRNKLLNRNYRRLHRKEGSE